MRLKRSFFGRPTLDVARDLLGQVLVRQTLGARLTARIVEVEAYVGTADTACHASRGRTARTERLFGPPGYAYVYFTYGMHWMLNVVTERRGFPAAVLIRAVEPLEGLEAMRQRRGGRRDRELTSGPARLCQALGIDGALGGTDLAGGTELFLRARPPVLSKDVSRTPRIGIDYAAPKDRKALWRFCVATSPYLSRLRTPNSTRRRKPDRC